MIVPPCFLLYVFIAEILADNLHAPFGVSHISPNNRRFVSAAYGRGNNRFAALVKNASYLFL